MLLLHRAQLPASWKLSVPSVCTSEHALGETAHASVLLNKDRGSKAFATTSGAQIKNAGATVSCRMWKLFFYIHLFEVELGLRFYIAENYFFFGDKS